MNGISIKGAQTLPQMQITNENIVECVQKLYDLQGASQNGRINDNSVYYAGVRLTALTEETLAPFLKDILTRLDALEQASTEGEN